MNGEKDEYNVNFQ